MKKLLTLIGIVVLTQCVQAAPVMEESFNYTEGDALGYGSTTNIWTSGSSLGSGPLWTNRASAALSYSGLAPSSGLGVRLTGQPSSNRDRGRPFSILPITNNYPNVYCSFLMRLDSTPSGNKLIAYLRSDTGAGTPVIAIWVDSNRRLGLTKSSDDPSRLVTMSSSIPLGATNFIVARYHFVNGETTGDSADVWLNPHPGTFTASEPFIPPPSISTNFGTYRNQVQAFVLANRSSGNGAASADVCVDEIRVGRTWADVTPAVPGMATKLVFTTPPTNTTAGAIMSPVVVQIQDSYGTPIAQSGVPVTVSLLVGNGTLSGTLTRNTDATGKATFNDLSINKVNAVAVLTATASNLYEATSGLFAVSGGGTPKSPRINQAIRQPNSIILRGTNGDPGQPYQVLASSNVSAPLNTWTVVGSSTFDGSGNFDFTNAVSPGDTMKFYAIKPTGSGGAGGGVEGPSGFATIGGITGGAGGPVRLIDNLAAFTMYGQSTDPVIMLVRSNIVTGTSSTASSFYLGPNKTIIGVGTNVTITGNLAVYGAVEVATPCTNVIIRNLVITNPGDAGEGDGISVKYGGRNLWVDHCTFIDCPDGMLDVTRESDFVTVSWCRFYYSVSNYAGHPDVNLIGGSDSDTTDMGKLHVTFHHNWWGSWCRERMPSVRYGRAHVYNNYYNCPGNNYCTRTRLYAEVLVENNYFQSVQNPWELIITSGTTGKLRATGNITNNCTWNASYPHNTGGTLVLIPGTDTLSTGENQLNPPPYAYTLDPAADIPNIVTNNAGAGRGPFAP